MPSRLLDSVRAENGTGRLSTGYEGGVPVSQQREAGDLPDYRSRDGGDRVRDQSSASAGTKACTDRACDLCLV